MYKLLLQLPDGTQLTSVASGAIEAGGSVAAYRMAAQRAAAIVDQLNAGVWTLTVQDESGEDCWKLDQVPPATKPQPIKARLVDVLKEFYDSSATSSA